jgi:hypothetical protein
MYSPVTSVKPIAGYRLELGFGNGEKKIFNVTPYLNIGKFAELKDVSLFNSVTVKFDSIEWANHLDLDPEFLYANSVSVKKSSLKSLRKVAQRKRHVG